MPATCTGTGPAASARPRGGRAEWGGARRERPPAPRETTQQPSGHRSTPVARRLSGRGKQGLVADEAEPGACIEVVGLTDAHRLVGVGHVVLRIVVVEAVAPVAVAEAMRRAVVPTLEAAMPATVVAAAVMPAAHVAATVVAATIVAAATTTMPT